MDIFAGAALFPFSLFSTFVVPLLISVTAMVIAFFIFYWLRNRRLKKKAGNKNFGLPVGGEHGEPPTTRFSDIAGADEAVEELAEMVERLKNPERWEKWHIPPPKGALMYGPPGTGKTLLAKAVAGEAGVPFYAVSGSDFVEMYVGVGASRVRELFTNAKKEKDGAIIFIDEVDAIGRSRGGAGTDNAEHENSLNALLVELDGFTGRSNVVVLAATNRPELIDSALTRPGRLDRKVSVGMPDRSGRRRILDVHVEGKPFDSRVDMDAIAGRTPGLSGADLAQIVHEACLNAARRDGDVVSVEDADHAVATVVMGKARHSAVVSPRDRLITAWHEAGHTVASMMLKDADAPVSVTIIPRGPAGGFTWMSSEDRQYFTVSQMYARIVVAMAGRAAEELLLGGEFTTGPSGDYSTATKVAYHMVSVYGMTGEGLISYENSDMAHLLASNAGIRETVNKVLSSALTDARKTVSAHMPLLEDVVDGLMENDTLTLPDLLALSAKHDTHLNEVVYALPDTDRVGETDKGREKPVRIPAVRPQARRWDMDRKNAGAPGREDHVPVGQGEEILMSKEAPNGEPDVAPVVGGSPVGGSPVGGSPSGAKSETGKKNENSSAQVNIFGVSPSGVYNAVAKLFTLGSQNKKNKKRTF